MKNVNVTIELTNQELKQTYRLFGGVFFGFIAAMYEAGQGWCYQEGNALARNKNIGDYMGVNYPDSIEIPNEDTDKGTVITYSSRSGKEYIVTHEAPNLGGGVNFISLQEDSSLLDGIKKIKKDSAMKKAEWEYDHSRGNKEIVKRKKTARKARQSK